MKKKYICIHGHFYQPPRENPWLEEVELQDSAYPYHDWNERVTEECYAPNTASRILDRKGRIVNILNIYSRISFNFGPTLLSWLERHKKEVYQAVLEADRKSRERFGGHGSAMAQVYNHMIMPLADRKDKYTQALWGMEDFRHRFGRDPEGMWLPETAVDYETLEVLAELGIRFTVLAPRQARRIRPLDGEEWTSTSHAKVDPTRPYLCRLPSGAEIVLFFYDGPIAQDVAFGGLLGNGEDFARRLLGTFPARDEPRLVHIATDGETYGHHHRGGDMALAYCLHYIESESDATLTNYGEYAEMHPPDWEAEIYENSSWSCVHGVERWRDDCGCHVGMGSDWNQAWRKPLREAMDWLRDRLVRLFEREASRLLRDPWAARDAYVAVILDRGEQSVERFVQQQAVRKLSDGEKARVLKLMEMQRNAQLIFTSCGWFFDEISGIEAVQVMQYAAQAMQYHEELQGTFLEPDYLALLEGAPSNVFKNATQVYESAVRPARVDHLRVGAHYGISSLFEDYPDEASIYCYTCSSRTYHRLDAGRVKFISGVAKVVSDRTWDIKTMTFAVLHLGDQNITAGVREFITDETYEQMHGDVVEALEKGDVTSVIRLIDHHFGPHTYSLWHLFRDEQRKILGEVLKMTYEEIESSYRQVYDNNYPLMNFLQSMNVPLPRPLVVAAEYVTNRDLRFAIEADPVDDERLRNIIGDIKRWSLVADRPMMEFYTGAKIRSLMERFRRDPRETAVLADLKIILELLRDLPVRLDLWKVQNIFFSMGKEILPEMRTRAKAGEAGAKEWVQSFLALEPYLKVKLP